MNKIVLDNRKIIRVLLITGIILFILSVAGQMIQYLTESSKIQGLINMFSLGLERNIPTYFSSFLSLLASLLLLLITILQRKSEGPYITRWAILALGFFYISIDEIVIIHERLIRPVSSLLGVGNLGIFTFAWVIPAILMLVFLALYFFKFLLHLDYKTQINFLIAALLFIGGAIGFELIGGRYYGLHGEDNLPYRMLQNIEESLEIAGLIVFIRALLEYACAHFGNVMLIFDSSKRSS